MLWAGEPSLPKSCLCCLTNNIYECIFALNNEMYYDANFSCRTQTRSCLFR